MLLLSALVHFLQWEHNGTLVAEKAALNTQLTTAKGNADAQGKSATEWQKAAQDCSATNKKIVEQKAALEEKNASAAAQAAIAETKAKKDLANWQKQYQAAMHNQTCVAILNTSLSVCPELMQ